MRHRTISQGLPVGRYDVRLLSDCQKSSDSNIQPNPRHDDAQSPGLLLVKTIRARRPRAARQKENRGKEQKEKGLLLHPPLSHKPT
jgi:hypothetical protein